MANATVPRSALWIIADTGVTTLISMFAMLVMARLIGPAEFGSAALAIGLIQVVNLYVEGLLHDALIQSHAIDRSAFDEGFWLVMAVGSMFAAVAAVAWFALRGTDAASLALLICVSSASLPFSGMTGICNARLRREMDYKLAAAPSVAAKLFSSLIGLGSAFAGVGAWSLVAQFVTGAVIQAVGLLVASGWRPRLRFSVRALRPLWAFALPYAIMHTLVGVRIQGFTTLAAASGGLSAAGYINVAFRLTLTPQILLTTTLTNLGLPLLARHQHDRGAFGSAFHHLNKMVALGLPVAFFGLAACADLLVRVLLGTQWLPTIIPMQIFGVGAGVYFLRMPSTLMLRALGHVRYSVLNAIMHIVITLGAMVLLRPQNATVDALLWVAPLVPLVPLTLLVVRRETGLQVQSQLDSLVAPASCAVAMAVAIVALKPMLQGFSAGVALATCIGAGLIVYTALVLATDMEARTLMRTWIRVISARVRALPP